MLHTKPRILGLDFIRASVALFVVFHHLSPIFPLPQWLLPVTSMGSLGVELLFVLAGFLLGQTLLRLVKENRFSTTRDLSKVLFKRWLRILPAYYVFLLLSAALFLPFFQVLSSHLSYFFFLQNIAWDMPSFYFQTWTLAVLEFFYVLFSLSFFLTWKASRHKLLSFAICIGLFGLVPLVLKATCTHLLGTEAFEATIRKWVVYRLDAPAVGVLMALLLTEFPKIWNWLCAHSWIGLTLFGGTIAYHLAGFPLLYTSHWAEVLFYPLVGISFALTLPLLFTWKHDQSLLSRGIAFISKLSYSIYVSHLFSIVLLWTLVARMTSFDLTNNLIIYPVSFAFVILVAWLSYHFVESPFIKPAQAPIKVPTIEPAPLPEGAMARLGASPGLL